MTYAMICIDNDGIPYVRLFKSEVNRDAAIVEIKNSGLEDQGIYSVFADDAEIES